MFDNYDEGWYCEQCDESYPDDDFEMVAVDEYYERFKCPHCGYVYPKVVMSDYGYDFREYLLFGSNWDEGALPLLAHYP